MIEINDIITHWLIVNDDVYHGFSIPLVIYSTSMYIHVHLFSIKHENQLVKNNWEQLLASWPANKLIMVNPTHVDDR